jgi:hypothetical protein
MPHFGLIDENKLGPVESLLMRARLHIRCGKRRVREEKVSLGILTLYDALNSALQWYVSLPEQNSIVEQNSNKDFRDEETIIEVLIHAGILDGSFDYNELNEIVDKALKEELSDYNCTGLMNGIENVMVCLGVMPFDESKLPPEDPETV